MSERPSSAGFAATFPQGGRQGSTHTVLMYAPARPAARGGNKLSIAPNNIQKRRNRILPFFPYEHTDGGECAARFNKREPLKQTGLPKIAAQRDFWERGAAGAAGKAASIARRLPWRLAATSSRGEKPPPARRVILRDERMAGFPLPHGKSQAAACRDFREQRQLETKFVNHY